MFEPTAEQRLIVEAARTTSSNLLVNSLAGCAKTTTLELICKAVTGIPILSLAFNKRIADEMVKRLPSHVECRTMNALGHRVWSQVIGKRLVVDSRKMHTILTGLVKALPKRGQETAWEDFADTLKWLRYAKRDGYVPPRWRLNATYSAGSFANWLEAYDDEPTGIQIHLIDAAMSASIEAAYAGGIDFDDQIYMPVVFGGSWPRYPLVLIDEAQDLSPLNHEMLARLVTRRLIAVGDPWQSIYGFRGAVANGMAALRERFSMRELTLSITFRVPRAGVQRARARVPHFQWAPNAPEGEIVTLDEWNDENIPDGAAIICRNNAPLFSCALRLLASGRGVKLVGMDIGPNLVRIMRKLGPLTMSEADTLDAIQVWGKRELVRAKRAASVYDRIECLNVLVTGRPTLRDAITWTEDLFKRDGLIQLLSGHKAKGLEWDTVFHLDAWRIPSKFAKEGEEMEQELNVRYVIETRFKERLFLVNMEGWR